MVPLALSKQILFKFHKFFLVIVPRNYTRIRPFRISTFFGCYVDNNLCYDSNIIISHERSKIKKFSLKTLHIVAHA